MDKESIARKKERLIHLLRDAGSLLVAYSGGVDSSLLLALAHEVLGDKAVAATATSDIYARREKDVAVRFTRERGIKHIVFESCAMSLPAFVSNGPDRCYHCKRCLFQQLVAIAEERNIRHIADGSNMDDLRDYRPGLTAGRESGIVSPFIDADLKKDDMRFLAKEMGLFQWDKPAMACLATRIPYGSPITAEKLKMIEEAEAFLLDRGVRQCRVRHHGLVARIELDDSGLKLIMGGDLRKAIVNRFREIGFVHIAVDLEGYVSGGMNRAVGIVTKQEKMDDE